MENKPLEEVVGRLLTRKHKTLAIAESATGGLICDKITNVPGSSRYFMLGIVSYSNESKVRELGVPPEIIKRYGAVSERAARLMAEGVRDLARTDYSLGVTGICGPTGATKDKPVGLVYIAKARAGETTCQKFLFTGGRRVIKAKACRAALKMLRKKL